MKLKTLVAAVALLAILSVVAYLGNRPEAPAATDPRVGKPVLDPDTVSHAARIVVSDKGKSVELDRGPDGTWVDTSYYGMPADFDKVAQLMRDLNESKVERFVTSNPDRLSHLDFNDSLISLADASGKEIWSLTIGKTPDTGNGKFIRFGKEPVAFYSGLHLWLDTDAKGWADARLVTVKADDIAKVEIPFVGGNSLTTSRAKKDAPWTATLPPGDKLLPDKISAVVTSLTSLRFSDTVAADDPAAKEAALHGRSFKLTTFDGKTLTVTLGRKPEEKRLKAPTPSPVDTTSKDPKADAKLPEPEFETIPAGAVYVWVESSDANAPLNRLMKTRAFQTDEFTFTGLPQRLEDLSEPEKAK